MINTPQAPYFDDFDVEKNFLKILFKPKLSVQTRELEQIQSMFQHQIETLASQIFKNGSVVSGGKFTFEDSVDYVKVDNEYNSQIFNYGIYANRYVYGLTTKISARVFNGWSQGNNETATLYLDYLDSGVNQQQTYQPDEVLQLLSKAYFTTVSGTFNIGDTLQGQDSGAMATIININNNEYDVLYTTANTFTLGEQVIDNTTSGYLIYTAGESEIYKCHVKTTASDANVIGKGTAVFVDAGIYYIDGYFVYTDSQSKVVSPYTTTANVRVGFEKEVEIITSSEDPSLLDNANGYPNENAPGADRLKINLVLNYYNLFETPSENFVEIMTIEDSVVTGNASINQMYSEILDTLARRTYDESGNYTVQPFLIDIREFLDDGENNGIYKPEKFGYNTRMEAENAATKVFNMTTPTVHTYGTKYYPYSSHSEYLEACQNRLALGVETGKAYVMGYEINHEAKQWFPLLKARDTKTLVNSATTISYGNYIKVNTVKGLPDIYHHQLVQLSSDATFTADTNIIGTARVYAIDLDSGTPGSGTEVYRVYLENIQMTDENDFSSDVNSLGFEQAFSAKTVKSGGVNVFYSINTAPLITRLEKSMVSAVTNSSYNYKKVFTGIVNSSGHNTGVITVAPDQNSRFVDITDSRSYFLTITSGPELGNIINLSTISTTVDPSGNLVFANLPLDTIDSGFMLIGTLHKQTNNIKTKTLNVNSQYIATSGDYSEIVLDHADGYRLVGIYDSEDPDTAPTTSSTNVTENFIFDNGQRDTYYGLARVYLKEGAIAPSGQVLVVYDYFTHSAGDYFTADSYSGQIPYTDIPVYESSNTTYNLRDCIDFRGRVDDNASGNFTASTLPYIMQNNNVFENDLVYYQPRMDLLELDYKGNFNIKYGTSSDDPQYPVGSINSMTLYYLSMPAYTESPDDVIRVYCENKRYTMRDIGALDNRVSAIENYIMMSENELDTNNMPIYDLAGYQCIKTGFIVDMFEDHTYGDTDISGYRCSIDSENGNLRPEFKLNVVNLVKSTQRTSTVIQEGHVYMIPYDAKSYITNTVNTTYIALNSNQNVQWQGNVVLNKTLSTVYNTEGFSNINMGTSVSTTANASFYNQVQYSWLGTNTSLNS